MARMPRARRAIGFGVLVTILGFGALALPGLTAARMAAQASPAMTLTVNGLTLTACDAVEAEGYRSWCGTLRRPMVSGQPSSGPTIPVAFALVLPRAAAAGSAALASVLGRPALMAFEGGPGYGGIDSGFAYAQMLSPLLADRALIVMDARGTGRSSAIDCPSLQQGTADYLAAARACGRQLAGQFDDFGTASAADDAAALLSALGFTQADVYGDSYGTFMAQVLAGRHPEQVRSLVLDGAYPATGESAWFPTQGPALVDALTQVCIADPSCSAKDAGTVAQLGVLLERLRRKPMIVTAPGDDDRRHRVRLTPSSLLSVAFNGTYVDTTYRELDPAIRAALAGDQLPLGRLVAEMDYSGGQSESARENSAGQYLAVTCQDYPQLYDMTQPTSTRRVQLDAAINQARQQTPELFAPFTIDDYVNSGWQTLDSCLTWPAFAPGSVGPPQPSGGAYRDIPTLVLSGSLDTITTAAEGAMVASQFPRSRAIVVPYGVHVQAMGESVPCAADIVRAFMADPSTYLITSPVNTAPVNTVPVNAAPGTEAAPTCAAPRPRILATFQRRSTGLPITQAAILTAADVLNRYAKSSQSTGLGLRGGSWESLSGSGDGVDLRLTNVRLFEDLPVSGSVSWQRVNGAVKARLTIPGGSITATWSNESEQAQVRGTIHGAKVQTPVPAP